MGLRAPDLTISNARRLRRSLTLPEALLWEQLRRGRLEGLRFRRQHAVGPYVLDFYCAKARLAIEVDGTHHDSRHQMRHDNRRDGWLSSEGVCVLRIAASDILDDHLLEGALGVIALAAATGKIPEGYESPRWADGETPPPPPSAVPLPRFAGEEPKSRPAAKPGSAVPDLAGQDSAARSAAAPVLPPFAGEGDHAKRGEGGVLPSPIFRVKEGDQP
jgi:very-short-patch-repair endonuclease